MAGIGVDWGTTGFRAYRLGGDGAPLEIRNAEAGILAIDDGDFEGALESLIGDWLDADAAVPVVLSGMIGSRNGWREVPYLPCPASLFDLAAALLEVSLERGRSVWIAPGVSCRDADSVPDVMRGEEVQILGSVAALGNEEAVFCLPGTHSKWVRVRDRRIIGFATFMTGEVFDVLRRHSILGRGIEHAAWSDEAFVAGIDRSGDSAGLLHHAFGVRASGLFGELPPERAGAFLSGLLIGSEIRAAQADQPPGGLPIRLIGAEGLAALYKTALEHLGMTAVSADPHSGAQGLWTLVQAIASREAEK
jgi:2-dehydro-3-deoxygalactonokinase